jgi:hypothetical protein
LGIREIDHCNHPAVWRTELLFSNGSGVVVELCSEHMRWPQVSGDVYIARKFKECGVKDSTVLFHHIREDYQQISKAALEENVKSVVVRNEVVKTTRNI